jgi:hypothetical protein
MKSTMGTCGNTQSLIGWKMCKYKNDLRDQR